MPSSVLNPGLPWEIIWQLTMRIIYNASVAAPGGQGGGKGGQGGQGGARGGQGGARGGQGGARGARGGKGGQGGANAPPKLFFDPPFCPPQKNVLVTKSD